MLEQRLDLAFFCAIEHGRAHVHAARERWCQRFQFLVAHFTNGVSELRVLEKCLQFAPNRFSARVFLEQSADLLAQSVARPSQMGFENLTHIHTAGYAEGIQNDLDWRSV